MAPALSPSAIFPGDHSWYCNENPPLLPQKQFVNDKIALCEMVERTPSAAVKFGFNSFYYEYLFQGGLYL